MYHFIINPNAGSGRGWKVWRAIAGYMDRHNIEYEAVLTNGTGEAREASRELTKKAGKPCFLIVVGGDGTMNEVLDGASFHGPLNLGYIPAGTGNDLWRSLHMPVNPVRCLKKQLYPRHFSVIDYGVLSYGKGEPFHRRFLVSAGIGFDAAVCQAARDSRLRSRLGHMGFRRFSYLLLGI